MLTRTWYFWVGIALLGCTSGAWAQTDATLRDISARELVRWMEQGKPTDGEILIEGIRLDSVGQIQLTVHTQYPIRFRNCQFGDIIFNESRFDSIICIENSTIKSVYFRKCIANDGVHINQVAGNTVTIRRTYIRNGLVIQDSSVDLICNYTRLNVDTTSYNDDRFSFISIHEKAALVIQNNEGFLSFYKDTCDGHLDRSLIALSGVIASSTEFEACQLPTVQIEYCALGAFRLFDSNLNGDLFWANNNVPTENIFIMDYELYVDNKIFVKTYKDGVSFRSSVQKPGIDINLNGVALLVSSLKGMQLAYLSNGDLQSANAAYVDLKKLQTDKLAYDYAKAPSLQVYFSLQMNRFLGFFCDYGTNPAKALVYSFYLVLCFAGVYCFFPSVPDNLMRRRWLPYYQTLIRYLTETTRLPDLQGDRIAGRLAGLEQFRSALDAHTDDMPRLLRWLGKRLYRWASLSYRFRRWLYQKADVLPVTWQHLTRLQRMSVSFRLSAYTFLFLFWGLCMRLINALALSLNAFVTLGYGEIQARGVSRYLAVVEGVCGWLLLSIFSVSLISQLLQ